MVGAWRNRIASILRHRVDIQGPDTQKDGIAAMTDTGSSSEGRTTMESNSSWLGFEVPTATAATYGLGLCADEGIVRGPQQVVFDRDVDQMMHGRQEAQSKAGSIRISLS